MVLTINKNSSLREVEKLLSRLFSKKKKGLNARKYCGIIHLKRDALQIQKDLRNEWE
ncbi:MAG: hypothetical protein HY063_12625 [Bacteroidetes bacterium]|nr:hypothetical protein [Bacteroidota bacterium]